MNHDLEIARAFELQSIARTWRDRWGVILTFAILVEVAIDTFWRDRPRIYSPTWSEHFLEKKIIATFAVGVLIVVSLNRESFQGTIADEKADDIQRIQQTRIADAETRIAKANERTTKTVRALGTPMLFRDEPEFSKLCKFKGTPFFVQGLPRYPSSNDLTVDPVRVHAFEDSSIGVQSFMILMSIEWLKWTPPPSWRGPLVYDSVIIYSRRPKNFDLRLETESPYEMALDTPEGKAWAAGEALTQYMHSGGLPSVAHFPIAADSNGHIVDSRIPPTFPIDGVFITVGPRVRSDVDSLEMEVGGNEAK
jgi:hypothetical protein